MRVLITGVSGFVGGALGCHLKTEHGLHVMGLSRRPPRENATDNFLAADLAAGIPAVRGPLDAIVHCAALTSPWAPPMAFRQSNVVATRNVIELAHRLEVPYLVLISSSSVFYRPGDQLGITETTPLPAEPVNAYAATKREAERLVRASGLAAAIIRPRAVFGAGDTVLFPRILRAARFGVLPRFTRPDGGRAIGDVVSIDNLVRFIAAALERRVTGEINVTDGRPVDIYEFLGGVLEKLGLRPPRLMMPAARAMRIAGVMETISRTLLGWREPPLTRFGVAVLSQSKTFDISRARALLGDPAIPTAEAIDRFVAWQKAEWR